MSKNAVYRWFPVSDVGERYQRLKLLVLFFSVRVNGWSFGPDIFLGNSSLRGVANVGAFKNSS